MSELEHQSNKLLDNLDNPKYRKQVLEFQERVNDYKKAGVKLTQNQIDAEQKWLDLIQARIALEEAQKAKSTVRLQRDNEGNWGYVFANDNDAIADAEANAQKALYEYQKSMRDTQDDIEATARDIIDGIQEQLQAAQEDYLNGELGAGEEGTKKFQERITEIMALFQEQMMDENVGLAAQYDWMAKNLNDTYEEMLELYGVDSANFENDFEDSLLGKIMGYGSLDDMFVALLDEFTKAADDTIAVYEQMEEEQDSSLQKVKSSLDTLDEDTQNWGDATSAASDKNIEAVEELANAFDTVMSDSLAKVQEQWGDWLQQMEETQIHLMNIVGLIDDLNRTIHYEGDYTGNNPVSIPSLEEVMNAGLEPEFIPSNIDLNNITASAPALSGINGIVAQLGLQAQTASLGFGNISSNDLISQLDSLNSTVDQNVHIDASFPNVTDRNEIEEAFENLVNKAAQYANRKRQG